MGLNGNDEVGVIGRLGMKLQETSFFLFLFNEGRTFLEYSFRFLH